MLKKADLIHNMFQDLIMHNRKKNAEKVQFGLTKIEYYATIVFGFAAPQCIRAAIDILQVKHLWRAMMLVLHPVHKVGVLRQRAARQEGPNNMG